MPSFYQVNKLKDICIKNIIDNIDKYWVEKTKIKQLLDSTKNQMIYLVGPFETLNDHYVDFIMKEIYKKTKLTKYHIYLLINTYLKKLDFSFIRKVNLVDSKLCSFIGANAYVGFSLFSFFPLIIFFIYNL
jgi:hypothetical protein